MYEDEPTTKYEKFLMRELRLKYKPFNTLYKFTFPGLIDLLERFTHELENEKRDTSGTVHLPPGESGSDQSKGGY